MWIAAWTVAAAMTWFDSDQWTNIDKASMNSNRLAIDDDDDDKYKLNVHVFFIEKSSAIVE